MIVLWALLCRNTITDKETNNISLIEVVDELTIPGPPPQTPDATVDEPSPIFNLYLVALWSRSDIDEPEEGDTRIRAITPDDRHAVSPELHVDLTEAVRARSIGRLVRSPFVVSRQGVYRFKLEARTTTSDWIEMFEAPLWISIQTEQVN